MNRRTFLKLTPTVAIAGSWPAALTDLLAQDEKRKATARDIEGPYYRDGAPERTNLRGDKDKGLPLTIAGTVLDENGKPIAKALLDLWQADHAGEYDNDTKEFRYRGRLSTNEKGEYSFETVLPGRYDLGNGTFRPRHIHVKASAKNFAELTTQLYFELEKGERAEKTLVVPLKYKDAKSSATGEFTFVLAKK
jgi:protocatechuate 3,4-dioxygenase beta subunit